MGGDEKKNKIKTFPSSGYPSHIAGKYRIVIENTWVKWYTLQVARRQKTEDRRQKMRKKIGQSEKTVYIVVIGIETEPDYSGASGLIALKH